MVLERINFVVERASRALVFEGSENVAYTQQQQHEIFTFASSRLANSRVAAAIAAVFSSSS